MLSGVARVSHSYKSGAHEWRWPTQAQLTRREFVDTSMSWAESDMVVFLPLSLRKVSQHVCVSGFGVGQSASSRVCCNVVVCCSVRKWRVLGSILARAGKLLLLCTGLPQLFNIIIIINNII